MRTQQNHHEHILMLHWNFCVGRLDRDGRPKASSTAPGHALRQISNICKTDAKQYRSRQAQEARRFRHAHQRVKCLWRQFFSQTLGICQSGAQ
jgi:hypothetical protein